MEQTRKKMGRKDMEQLVRLLDQFFPLYDLHERNICLTNPVAKVLRGHLVSQGRWKVETRGRNKRKATFNQMVKENFKASQRKTSEPAAPTTVKPYDLPRDHPNYCPF